MSRAFRILEIIWLIMGCIGIAMCAYNIIMKDNRGAIYFLVFTFVCGVMYSIRKRQRKKSSQTASHGNREQQQGEKK